MVVRRKPAPSPGVFNGSAHSARVAGAVCGSVHNAELSFRHAAVGDREHRQECLCHKASRKRGAVCSKKIVLLGPGAWSVQIFSEGQQRCSRSRGKPQLGNGGPLRPASQPTKILRAATHAMPRERYIYFTARVKLRVGLKVY